MHIRLGGPRSRGCSTGIGYSGSRENPVEIRLRHCSRKTAALSRSQISSRVGMRVVRKAYKTAVDIVDNAPTYLYDSDDGRGNTVSVSENSGVPDATVLCGSKISLPSCLR